METFADVLHTIIDHVLDGEIADKAHSVIDRASGTRTTPQEETAAAPTPADSSTPAADPAPPTG